MSTENKILHFTTFSNMTKWSATVPSSYNINNQYPLVQLSDILFRIKDSIKIDDNTLYKRITVRINGQGVLKRDELMGKDIGTKKQFVAHAGQLIVSRIDARNGAFGIVPKDLEGAIVTNDFWLFNINKELSQYLMSQYLISQYLILVMSSKAFQKYWQVQSSGTTNRQRISEDDFLNSKIPLPFSKLKFLLEKYNEAIEKADEDEKSANRLNDEIDTYILSALDCKKINITENNSLLHIKKYSKIINWSVQNNVNSIGPKELFVSGKYDNTPLSLLAEINPETKYPDFLLDENITFLPMECISDVYGDISEKKIGNTNASKGYTRFKNNDILWAKITPCMQNGKCAIAYDLENGYGYGSTEFHVIRVNTEKVLPEYIYCILRTKLVRRIAKLYFSGSAGQQRVNADFLENLNIPLLPLKSDNKFETTQKKIVDSVFDIKNRIKILRTNATKLRQNAKKDFEDAIFNE